MSETEKNAESSDSHTELNADMKEVKSAPDAVTTTTRVPGQCCCMMEDGTTPCTEKGTHYLVLLCRVHPHSKPFRFEMKEIYVCEKHQEYSFNDFVSPELWSAICKGAILARQTVPKRNNSTVEFVERPKPKEPELAPESNKEGPEA